MDRKNRMRQIGNVLKSATLTLVIVFVGVPLVSAIEVENPASIAVLLGLIACSFSTLYLC